MAAYMYEMQRNIIIRFIRTSIWRRLPMSPSFRVAQFCKGFTNIPWVECYWKHGFYKRSSFIYQCSS
ncbi:hypothetical protein RYX36_021823, partial [Vicia faba]